MTVLDEIFAAAGFNRQAADYTAVPLALVPPVHHIDFGLLMGGSPTGEIITVAGWETIEFVRGAGDRWEAPKRYMFQHGCIDRSRNADPEQRWATPMVRRDSGNPPWGGEPYHYWILPEGFWYPVGGTALEEVVKGGYYVAFDETSN